MTRVSRRPQANEMYTRLFGPRSVLARVSSVIRTSLVVWYGRWGVPFGVVPHVCREDFRQTRGRPRR